MNVRLMGSVVVLSVLAFACAGSDEPVSTEPIFGTEDTACTSVRLVNGENDDELLSTVVECFIAEIDADRPVTVDIAAASVEGDPIYNRFAFDGDKFLIVEDNRADEFASAGVIAKSCSGISIAQWLPEGTDCESVDHAGFPDAVVGE